VEVTSSPDDAFTLARHAQEYGYECVVVAGGDGTINQVINGLGDYNIPLGIIPLGTGNVLAHDLGIPAYDITRALKIIEAGKIREVDLAAVGDRRFVLMAGLGFDAAVVGSVSPKVKDVLGTVAYAPAFIEQLIKFNPVRFRLTFGDGSATYETQALAVVVANCGTYAYNFKIAPEAVFDDGMLDILVFESNYGTTFNLIGQALETFFQQQILNPNTSYFRATRVRVESDPPVKMQIDGDVAGESGVDIRVLPKALKLIVP
ncbi:diacylglycerol kinase family lipid kinase, partial [bacterium]|nr:diacylglycerol kinase family lipid kinase [bacterium]